MKLFLETECISCLRQFLYPSEEDMYKLIRFLVGRLSESSQTSVSANVKDSNANGMMNVENTKRSSSDDDNERRDLHTEVKGLTPRTEEELNSIQYVEEDIAGDVVNKGGNLKTQRDGQHPMSHQEASILL